MRPLHVDVVLPPRCTSAVCRDFFPRRTLVRPRRDDSQNVSGNRSPCAAKLVQPPVAGADQLGGRIEAGPFFCLSEFCKHLSPGVVDGYELLLAMKDGRVLVTLIPDSPCLAVTQKNKKALPQRRVRLDVEGRVGQV